jgi:hypothetical protein
MKEFEMIRVLSLFLTVTASMVLADDSLSAEPSAAEKAELTWNDPAKATAEDPDFSIQGEYGVDAKGQAWAVQVVALGGGQFDAYLLEGGLPGLGWTREKARIPMNGRKQGPTVDLASEDGSVKATIADGQIVVVTDGKPTATFERIVRTSPTLGAKPPEGAVVLFDGTSTDAWNNGQIENGLLFSSGTTSKQAFGDYTMHLEVRTPYKPYARGQGRGNSGVYHHGRYETQVLDSFGLEGAKNEFGGIYSIADSRINMCLPPLTWQTYDVDFTAPKFDKNGELHEYARMTVRVNGVTVHDDQELPKTTTAAPFKKITPDPGPIFLQDHRNPIYYRNIWVLPK